MSDCLADHKGIHAAVKAMVMCCLVLALPGCRQDQSVMKIRLPADFHGDVTVNCLGYDFLAKEIDVEVPAEGDADAVACPKESSKIVVTDGHKVISVAGSIDWKRTGDGYPVELQFSVP